MSSVGFDRRTGARLSGVAEVAQQLEILFATRIGARVMLRSFGFAGLSLLGQPQNRDTILRFWMAVYIAIELWVPQVKLRQILAPAGVNTPERLRAGQPAFSIDADYLPRAHLGDMTVEGPLNLGFDADGRALAIVEPQ